MCVSSHGSNIILERAVRHHDDAHAGDSRAPRRALIASAARPASLPRPRVDDGLVLGLPPESVGRLDAAGEGLDAIGSDQQRVLELGGALAVARRRGPRVVPLDVTVGPLAQHRLDREDVADLHIKEGENIHFRMSRGLRDRDFPKPTKKWIERVIFSMCPEHFVEDFKKDREVDFSYFNPKFGRFRVNVFSQTGKWAMAMRYIKNDLPPIEKLGINPICLKLAEAKRGLTLLAGITGSGKSTTMAAMVMHLNKNFRRHIITIGRAKML